MICMESMVTHARLHSRKITWHGTYEAAALGKLISCQNSCIRVILLHKLKRWSQFELTIIEPMHGNKPNITYLNSQRHKRSILKKWIWWHPISHPNEWAMGNLSWVIWRKITTIYWEWIAGTCVAITRAESSQRNWCPWDSYQKYFMMSPSNAWWRWPWVAAVKELSWVAWIFTSLLWNTSPEPAPFCLWTTDSHTHGPFVEIFCLFDTKTLTSLWNSLIVNQEVMVE